MKKKTTRVVVAALLASTVWACAMMSAPLSSSLKQGQEPPSNQVLVIGKFMLDPPLKQGSLTGMSSARGELRDVIKLLLTKELSQPVKPDELVPLAPDELIDAKYPGTSFVPLAPGTRYVRLGQYATSVSSKFVDPAKSSMVIANANTLWLYGDIKLTVPAGAKAVYIGTIVYKHDGYNTTAVVVRDEYAEAMQQLGAMKLTSVRPKDVVKSLAAGVGKPLQRKK
jgi:hypothetical protein